MHSKCPDYRALLHVCVRACVLVMCLPMPNSQVKECPLQSSLGPVKLFLTNLLTGHPSPASPSS